MDLKSKINDVLQEGEIIKSSGMIFAVTFIGSVFLFVSNIVLSRHFGPELFGNFKTVINLFLFLPSLIELGAGVTLTKYIAEFGKDRRRIGSLVRWFLKLRLFVYLILMVVVLALSNQIAVYFLKDASLNYLVLAGVLIIGMGFFEIFKSIVLGFQNFKLYSYSQFLTVAFTGMFTIVLGYYFGVFYAIVGWALSYLVGNIPAIRFALNKGMSKSNVKLDIKKIFLRYSFPMHLMIIPGFLGTAVIPILSLFFSQKLVGYYSFAWIFYSGVLLISGALASVLLPKVSELNGKRNYKRCKDMLERVFIVYTPIVALGIIGCLLLSKFAVKAIAPDYLPGLNILNILIVFGLVSGYLSIYRSYLSGLASIKKLSLLVLVQNIALFVVSFISMFM